MLLPKTPHLILLLLTLPPGLWGQDAKASEAEASNEKHTYTSWLKEISWQPAKPKIDEYRNPYLEKAKVIAKQLTNSPTYHKNLKKIAAKWQSETMPDIQAMEGFGVKPSSYDPTSDMFGAFKSHTEDLVLSHTGLKDLTKGFSFSFNPSAWFSPSEPKVASKPVIKYTSELVEITPDFSGPATAAINSDPVSMLPHAGKAKLKWQLVPKKVTVVESEQKQSTAKKAHHQSDYEVSNLWDAVRYRSTVMSFLSLDFTGDIKSEGAIDPRKKIPNQTLRLRQQGGLYALQLTGDPESFKPSAIHTLSAPLTQIFRYESVHNDELNLVKYGLLASTRKQSKYSTSVYNRVQDKLWELNFSKANLEAKLNFRIIVPSYLSQSHPDPSNNKEKIELSYEMPL
jgi:hypothetical protein